MTTQTREELLKLANAASKNGEHIYSNPRDCNNWKANEEWQRAASPEAFLAMLSAPPSSAQTDQVWNEAVEASKACVKLHAQRGLGPVLQELSMLKRPLQAQEQASPAAQSGAVDELPEALNSVNYCANRIRQKAESAVAWCYEKYGSKNAPDGLLEDIAEYALSIEHSVKKARAAIELSRAQTAPAVSLSSVDLASVSDEERAAFEAWSKREGALNIMAARDAECEDGRFPATYYYAPTETAWRAWANGRAALSRPSAPAPVSEQPAQAIEAEPDFSRSETSETELWKNPLYPLGHRRINCYGEFVYTSPTEKITLSNLRSDRLTGYVRVKTKLVWNSACGMWERKKRSWPERIHENEIIDSTTERKS